MTIILVKKALESELVIEIGPLYVPAVITTYVSLLKLRYRGDLVNVSNGALFPDVADAAVILLLSLKAT